MSDMRLSGTKTGSRFGVRSEGTLRQMSRSQRPVRWSQRKKERSDETSRLMEAAPSEVLTERWTIHSRMSSVRTAAGSNDASSVPSHSMKRPMSRR